MQQADLIKNLQEAMEKHKSIFVIGKSLLDELYQNRFFDEYEKEKIGDLLETIAQDISENRAMIASILQYIMDGEENTIY